MKYAILSDVHANLEALTAVLEAAQAAGAQRIVCLGDFVGYHANPDECIELLRSHEAIAISGNHDRAALGSLDPKGFGELGRRSTSITRRMLSASGKRYLEGLPALRIVDGDFLIVHGALHPAPNDELHLSTGEKVARSMAELRARYPVPLAFFGHTHHPAAHRFSHGKTSSWSPPFVAIEPGSTYLVNPGSVGQSRDEDPRAAFAIYDGAARTVTFRRVAYDRAECLRKARRAGFLPPESTFARRALRSIVSRAAAARAIGGARVAPFILRIRARAPSPWLTVLAYHRVADLASKSVLDDGVVDATPASFDRQMSFIARNFNTVGIEELLAFQRGGSLPSNPLAITFDDGYLDNYQHALPVLRRYGLRATFFVATSFIGSRRVFWWDRLAHVLRSSKQKSLQLRYPYPLALQLKEGPFGAIRRLLRLVKEHAELDLDRLLDELCRAARVDWTPAIERALAGDLIMTWSHVRALREAGMDVQSHTRTHRELHTVAPSLLKGELLGSREELEAELREPVRALSYPVGRPIVDCPVLRKAVSDAGYDLGFAMSGGVNSALWRQDPLNLRRIGMNREWSDAQFRGVLLLPHLAQ
jgi:peptidoglycan/xylan/chitin deacetylase (PgdA/CDA1 family)/predicted phosphodiesterase